jgi:beta-N-acetylhexosaminidase
MKDLGQLIITGIGGLTLSAAERDFLEKEKIGGVILFSKNFSDPVQLKALTDSINSLAFDHPFFICVDHEGGRVIRFKK